MGDQGETSLVADIVKTATWVFIYHAARELQQELYGEQEEQEGDDGGQT